MSAGAPFPHCGAAHGASGGPRAGPESHLHFVQKAAKDSWRHVALSVCVSCKIRHFVAFRWHDASQVVWSLLPGDIYDTLIATRGGFH